MIKSLLLTVFLLLTISLTGIAQKERKGTSRWIESDGSTELSVTMRNDVRFNDDYTDVLSISRDGFLEARERRGGLTHEIRITSSANGQIVRTYTVNGETRPYVTEGKNWLARMLAEAVSKGFDAHNRAVQIIRQRGVSALLNEVQTLKGDYTKRIYLEEAVKSGNLDAGVLQEVLKQAERDVSSDYEKATLLINVIDASSINSKTHDDYFAAIDTIKSDYERARVLKAVLKTNPENKEILLPIISSATKIGSDYEKANVLIQVAQAKTMDERIRAAFLSAVKTIGSDHERGRVLNVIYLNEVK